MSDDLIERMRDWPYQGESMVNEAADLIEQLEREQSRLHTQCDGLMQAAMNNAQALILAEAKLAKAVEALRKIAAREVEFWDEDSGINVLQWLDDEEMADIAIAVLAKLEEMK